MKNSNTYFLKKQRGINNKIQSIRFTRPPQNVGCERDSEILEIAKLAGLIRIGYSSFILPKNADAKPLQVAIDAFYEKRGITRDPEAEKRIHNRNSIK